MAENKKQKTGSQGVPETSIPNPVGADAYLSEPDQSDQGDQTRQKKSSSQKNPKDILMKQNKDELTDQLLKALNDIQIKDAHLNKLSAEYNKANVDRTTLNQKNQKIIDDYNTVLNEHTDLIQTVKDLQDARQRELDEE
ncbi:unnamed protein product, partial [Rotaria magnacalcarata]